MLPRVRNFKIHLNLVHINDKITLFPRLQNPDRFLGSKVVVSSQGQTTDNTIDRIWLLLKYYISSMLIADPIYDAIIDQIVLSKSNFFVKFNWNEDNNLDNHWEPYFLTLIFEPLYCLKSCKIFEKLSFRLCPIVWFEDVDFDPAILKFHNRNDINIE